MIMEPEPDLNTCVNNSILTASLWAWTHKYDGVKCKELLYNCLPTHHPSVFVHFTKTVFLLAPGLTVDHQVRHLHGNLCLLLHFHLLLHLGSDTETATSCFYTGADRPAVNQAFVALQWPGFSFKTRHHVYWHRLTKPQRLSFTETLLPHGQIMRYRGLLVVSKNPQRFFFFCMSVWVLLPFHEAVWNVV